jgi:hypothetical protein
MYNNKNIKNVVKNVFLYVCIFSFSSFVMVLLSSIYNKTSKVEKNYSSASPFPDVSPIVAPPPVDPISNKCFEWCAVEEGSFEPCVSQLQKCDTDAGCDVCSSNETEVEISCQSVEGYFNDSEQKAQAEKLYKKGKVCLPVKKSCLNPKALVKCKTSKDCGVCSETSQDLNGALMSCEYVSSNSNISLNGNEVENVPEGWYCLPERKACNMHAGRAVWTDEGWSCDCLWPTIMSGPACNTLVACSHLETSGSQIGEAPATENSQNSSSMQKLYVNCATENECGPLGAGPLESRVWDPSALRIDPLGCYCPGGDPTKNVPCGDKNSCNGEIPIPTTVCRCDGRQSATNQNFTYSETNRHTCVIDRCNVGDWGRKLSGDAAYFNNAIPRVIFSLKVLTPNLTPKCAGSKCYLFIDTTEGKSPQISLTTNSNFKFEMLGNYLGNDIKENLKSAIPGAWRQWEYNTTLLKWFNTGFIFYIDNDGLKVGGMNTKGTGATGLQEERYRFIMEIDNSATSSNAETPYNAVFSLYNPVFDSNSGIFPVGKSYIQYTDKAWNNNSRYLVFDPISKTTVLGSNVLNGSANPNLLILERTGWISVNSPDSSGGYSKATDYLPQPFNTCACSGQDSQTWFQSCIPSPGSPNVGNLAILRSRSMACDLLKRKAFTHLCKGKTTETCWEVKQACINVATTTEEKNACESDFQTCIQKVSECTKDTENSVVYADMCQSEEKFCIENASSDATKAACATTLKTCLNQFEECQKTKTALNMCNKATNPEAELVWEYQATCNPNGYVIPGSELVVPGAPDSDFCKAVQKYPPNMEPSASNMVPGLAKETGKIVNTCSADPCTGSYSDPLFNNSAGGGNWNPQLGQCECNCRFDSDKTQLPSDCFRSFPVDVLNENYSQSFTKCDHIENPVCGVCQNACQNVLLNSVCDTLPGYECPPAPSNMSCTTNLKGEPECVCGAECVTAEPQGSTSTKGVCIKKIPPGGSCYDFTEGSSRVCQTSENFQCTAVKGHYSSLKECSREVAGVNEFYPCEKCVSTNQMFRQCLPINTNINSCVIKNLDDGKSTCGQINKDIYYCSV